MIPNERTHSGQINREMKAIKGNENELISAYIWHQMLDLIRCNEMIYQFCESIAGSKVAGMT